MDQASHIDGQDFRFFVPVEAYEDLGKGKDKSRRIRGWITTEHRDREDEVVLQDGLDFTEFLSFGWFNDNHKQSTGDILGYPETVRKGKTDDGKAGHYVDGYLLHGDGLQPYDKVWKLANDLEKQTDGKRKLGFSVEGKIERRRGGDGKMIAKAKVRNVAVTGSPVNPFTGLEPVLKALTAGSALDAPAAGPGEGFPLRTESLEGTPTNLTPSKKKKRKKRLDKSAGLDLLAREGITGPAAESVWSLAHQLAGR
jgi:hypothetical protein